MGDTAYVASRQAGLIILDISDPSNPSEIASYESTNYIDAVAVLDSNYIVIGDRDDKITFLDVTDFQNIDTLKTVNVEWPWRFEVVDSSYLFAPTYSGSYAYSVISLADTSVVYQETPPNGYNSYLASESDDSYLYLSNHLGIEVFDISNPSSPSYMNVIEHG